MDESIFKEIQKKLVRFGKVYGHTFVPGNWEIDPQLAYWSGYFRDHWQKLPLRYKGVLKEAGFIYRKPEIYWFSMYYKLSDFLVEKTWEDLKPGNSGNKKLYDWFFSQKQSYRRNRLSELQVKMLMDLGANLNSIRPSSDDLWRTMYKLLVGYKQKFGNCNVPSTKKEHKALSYWMQRQRMLEKNKELSQERIILLNEIGFKWSRKLQKSRRDNWEHRLNELIAYQKKFGSFIVSSVDPAYHSLRIWFDKLRGHEHELPVARRKKLLAIGFPFKEQRLKNREREWEKMYQQLRQFFRQHKHSRVSAHDKDNPKLAQWVIAQRKRRDKLSPEQKRKLHQLRFAWDIQKVVKDDHSKIWETNFKVLQKFYDKHGHCRITNKYPEKGIITWMVRQRRKKYRLTAEQAEKLKSVNFDWVITRESHIQNIWERRYNDLVAYYKEYGHSNVPLLHAPNRPLGSWVYNVKNKKIKLTPKRLEQLKKVKFQWPDKILTREEGWQEKYNQLVAFYKTHHHTKFSKSNAILYDWLKHQRQLNRLGKLKGKHKGLLEKIDKDLLQKYSTKHTSKKVL